MQKAATIIKQVLNKWQIDEVAFLDCENLIIINERHLHNFEFKTCILFIIPYRTEENNPRWISKYAAPRDYHYFCKEMFVCVEAELAEQFPGAVFKGFADNSPINERAAASLSGLGFIGDNKLFFSHRYGSYIFIGEILTDLPFELFADEAKTDDRRTECEHCGACARACPTNVVASVDYLQCLSYISQKKQKNADELGLMYKYKTAWGCDICQDCCPHNKRAEKSGINFFKKDLINEPTSALVEAMDQETFTKRAFSWRGRKTITDNLRYFEEQEQKREVEAKYVK